MAVKIAELEAGHRIHIPEDWAAECGIEGAATLEKVEGGILIRALASVLASNWDSVFATKLEIGGKANDESELLITDDDLLF